VRRGRRFFQSLQQGVGGLIVHVVGVFDDKDTRGAFEWPKVGFSFQLAHGFDPNNLLEWTHHCEVGVLAPDEPLLIVVVAGERRECRSRDSLA
jgi:hypothetical protein